MDILCKDKQSAEYELEYLKTQRIALLSTSAIAQRLRHVVKYQRRVPYALFFGFTGTPIQLEIEKKKQYNSYFIWQWASSIQYRRR